MDAKMWGGKVRCGKCGSDQIAAEGSLQVVGMSVGPNGYDMGNCQVTEEDLTLRCNACLEAKQQIPWEQMA